MRGIHWGPDVSGTMGPCMLCLAAAGRKGCQVRVADLNVSSASASAMLLPCGRYCQACMG